MERPQAPDTLSMEDFSRLDIRVGTVLRAEAHHEAAPPAYRLWIDFGGLGVRQASAQITRLYRPEDLVGRQLAAVVNIQPRKGCGPAPRRAGARRGNAKRLHHPAGP